jgi:Rps23 Pro-64 3,4-dihydroxylase Tpa1-like proline 4-hydroxylase
MSYVYEKFLTSTNDVIEQIDNFYDYQKMFQIQKWILNQPFRFDLGHDSVVAEHRSRLVLHSVVNADENDYISRFEIDQIPELRARLYGKRLKRIWINAMTPTHVPRIHPDSFAEGAVTLLYYINLKWEADWDGFTIWRSNDLQKIEHVSDFKPGRLVAFDSKIPHKATVPSYDATEHRFTLNTVWEPS